MSISIGATGAIHTNGGNGGSDGTGNCGGGGGGSGGSLVLTSPTVTVDGQATSLGGTGGASAVPGTPYFGTGADGSVGRLRFDTVSGTSGGVGTVNPPAVVTTCSFPVRLQSFDVD